MQFDSIYFGLVSQQTFNVQNGPMSQTDLLNSYCLMQKDVLCMQSAKHKIACSVLRIQTRHVSTTFTARYK